MNENLATCMSRGATMIEDFYSKSPQSAVSQKLLLIQPIHVVGSKVRRGGALLASDDWTSDFVPAHDCLLAVGPDHLPNTVRSRLLHRGRLALFLNSHELADRSVRSSEFQIKRWIDDGWCLIWADMDVCDNLDLNYGDLAFPPGSNARIPNPFLAEIASIEGK